MSKRLKISAIVLVIFSLLSVSACNATPSSSASTSTASQSTTSSEVKKAPVKLSLFLPNSWNTGGLKAAISSYTYKTGNTIETEVLPDDQQENVFRTRLAAGTELPDLFCSNASGPDEKYPWAKEFAPLEGDWIKTLPQGLLKPVYQARDGKIYMAPYGSCVNIGVLYNKAVFKKAGLTPPFKTYNDLMAACETLKKAGVIPMSISNKEVWTAQMLYIASEDGLWNKTLPGMADKLKAGTVKYTEIPELMTYMDRIVSLKTKGYVNPDFMSTTMDMAVKDVATGRCAMTPAGDWSYAAALKNHPDQMVDLGMMPITFNDDYISVTQLSSSKTMGALLKGRNKNVEAAKEFIYTLITPELMKIMYQQDPGNTPYIGMDTDKCSWNADMTEFAKTLPMGVDPLMGFEYGDQAAAFQSLFAGKTSADVAKTWYNDLLQKNKAKKTPGF